MISLSTVVAFAVLITAIGIVLHRGMIGWCDEFDEDGAKRMSVRDIVARYRKGLRYVRRTDVGFIVLALFILGYFALDGTGAAVAANALMDVVGGSGIAILVMWAALLTLAKRQADGWVRSAADTLFQRRGRHRDISVLAWLVTGCVIVFLADQARLNLNAALPRVDILPGAMSIDLLLWQKGELKKHMDGLQDALAEVSVRSEGSSAAGPVGDGEGSAIPKTDTGDGSQADTGVGTTGAGAAKPTPNPERESAPGPEATSSLERTRERIQELTKPMGRLEFVRVWTELASSLDVPEPSDGQPQPASAAPCPSPPDGVEMPDRVHLEFCSIATSVLFAWLILGTLWYTHRVWIRSTIAERLSEVHGFSGALVRGFMKKPSEATTPRQALIIGPKQSGKSEIFERFGGVEVRQTSAPRFKSRVLGSLRLSIGDMPGELLGDHIVYAAEYRVDLLILVLRLDGLRLETKGETQGLLDWKTWALSSLSESCDAEVTERRTRWRIGKSMKDYLGALDLALNFSGGGMVMKNGHENSGRDTGDDGVADSTMPVGDDDVEVEISYERRIRVAARDLALVVNVPTGVQYPEPTWWATARDLQRSYSSQLEELWKDVGGRFGVNLQTKKPCVLLASALEGQIANRLEHIMSHDRDEALIEVVEAAAAQCAAVED